ncbi:hypothetical protein HMPREF1155_0494 [Slackia sp. CM382]|nr:hypothetical protein HMPREF1155_0494 [Slackia sp. CM382]
MESAGAPRCRWFCKSDGRCGHRMRELLRMALQNGSAIP